MIISISMINFYIYIIIDMLWQQNWYPAKSYKKSWEKRLQSKKMAQKQYAKCRQIPYLVYCRLVFSSSFQYNVFFTFVLLYQFFWRVEYLRPE